MQHNKIFVCAPGEGTLGSLFSITDNGIALSAIEEYYSDEEDEEDMDEFYKDLKDEYRRFFYLPHGPHINLN
ncbi:hypothetical protein EJB05_27875, partial [Eragrostis curvula]